MFKEWNKNMSKGVRNKTERLISEWVVERGGKMASRGVEESAECESEEGIRAGPPHYISNLCRQQGHVSD